ncbi:MAG TPA: PIN domain-containing protein [Solirubrobacteraceae bacterium]
MIVLDASVLIAHLDGSDAHHARATERLLDLAGEELGASSITLAEVLVAPTRANRLDAARAALRTLCIVELQLPADASERLASLRVKTSLKLPDCCVLLSAEAAGGAVLTFDGRLAREALKLGLAVND